MESTGTFGVSVQLKNPMLDLTCLEAYPDPVTNEIPGGHLLSARADLRGVNICCLGHLVQLGH